MRPAVFDIQHPTSLGAALNTLDAWGSAAMLLAGGQSLLKQLRERALTPQLVIDISRLHVLEYIRDGTHGLELGALLTLATLSREPRVAQACAALAEAASRVGDVQIRHRATLGGNLLAGWSGDLGVVLTALRAPVHVCDSTGTRSLSADEIVAGGIGVGEIIEGVTVPPHRASAFEKLSRRSADPALVSAAACVWVSDAAPRLGLAVGGAYAYAVRLASIEELYADGARRRSDFQAALESAASALTPPTTPHASAAYRIRVMPAIALRALDRALVAAGLERLA
jgi:aerobic carbon-monoxide dehydrogenase medium subunit